MGHFEFSQYNTLCSGLKTDLHLIWKTQITQFWDTCTSGETGCRHVSCSDKESFEIQIALSMIKL